MGPGIMDKFPGGAVCGLGPGLDGLILRLEAPGAGSAIWWTCGADDVVVVSCPSLGASVVAICWICWTSGWPLMKINWYDMAANGVRSHVLENQLYKWTTYWSGGDWECEIIPGKLNCTWLSRERLIKRRMIPRKLYCTWLSRKKLMKLRMNSCALTYVFTIWYLQRCRIQWAFQRVWISRVERFHKGKETFQSA